MLSAAMAALLAGAAFGGASAQTTISTDTKSAVNTATTYGYDSVTMMQETKTTLCQVAKV